MYFYLICDIAMSSIRLHGLSSASQLKEIVDQLNSNSGPDLIPSHGLARGPDGFVATLTCQSETTKSKALGSLKKILKRNHSLGETYADDDFYGITTLFSPEGHDAEVSLECVPLSSRSSCKVIETNRSKVL